MREMFGCVGQGGYHKEGLYKISQVSREKSVSGIVFIHTIVYQPTLMIWISFITDLGIEFYLIPTFHPSKPKAMGLSLMQ